ALPISQHDFQCLLVVVAGGAERGQLFVVDLALLGDDGHGKAGQCIQFRVVERVDFAQRIDELFRHAQFGNRELGVAGHAEAAVIQRYNNDLDHFPFNRAQAGAAVDGADDLVGLQGGGRVGQYADQVREKAVGLLRSLHAFAGGFGGGVNGMDGEAAHGRDLCLKKLNLQIAVAQV